MKIFTCTSVHVHFFELYHAFTYYRGTCRYITLYFELKFYYNREYIVHCVMP